MAEITEGLLLGLMNRDHHGHHNYRNNDDWRTEQNQANMSLMQSIGQVDKSVAVSTAEMQASQATQSAGIVAQLNSVTSSLAGRIDGLKDMMNSNALHLAEKMCAVDKSVMENRFVLSKEIMENRYELSKDITHDGDKTRNIVTTQYQDSLNRLLSEARNEISDLRNDYNGFRRAADNSLNVTQTVNQAQQQSQTNAHFDRLYHLLHGVGQNIRDTNTAINFGAGTLTNTNTPTNTNNSVGGL